MSDARPQTELAPLAGVHVVDLSGGLAGAYCGKLFRDAGAQVRRVDLPEAVPVRPWSVRLGGPDPLTAFLRAGSQTVALPGPDSADFGELLAWADVVVVSPAAGLVAPLGAAPEALLEGRPSLVVIAISPFGNEGPWRDRPANEFTIQALCGSSGRRGSPDREPLAAGGRLAEWAAGLTAAVAGLGSLLGARRHGVGDLVDVSVLEVGALIYSAYMPVAAQLADLPARSPDDTGRYTEIPSVLPAADGWVGFATNSAAQFRSFASMVGHPEWSQDPELSRADRRGFHADRVLPLIESWTMGRTVAEILELADAESIPAAPVGNGRVTPTFAHSIARGLFGTAAGADYLQPRVPYRMSRSPLAPFGSAPFESGPADPDLADEPARPQVLTRSEASTAALPLEGLRVFDFTAYWAGPIASQLLGWLGADVIKVESVQRPDGTRLGTSYASAGDKPWELAPLFHGANTGKRAITLDLTRPAGLDLAKALLGRCDVMVENFSPRVVDRFGLLSPDVLDANKGLVVLRLPAWGLNGPWRDRPGFAQNMEQATGLAWMTGYEGEAPIVPRGPCDPIGGLHAAFAVLAALFERDRSGLGQLVEAPLFDSAVNVAAEQVIDASLRAGAVADLPGRSGNRGPLGAPQGIYRCAAGSGWAALSIENDEQWQLAIKLLDLPAWAAEDTFATEAGRREHAAELDQTLARVLLGNVRDTVTETLSAAGIPAAPVIAADDVADLEQLRARGFFEAVNHPIAGEVFVPGPGVRWLRRRRPLHSRPAPLLGEHNAEVLGGLLGVSQDELARLTADDVIGTTPLASR
jgi:crotonobetainyl-CoA:carnitine CoA-transferase CaiB-like acyl-CoA transferase